VRRAIETSTAINESLTSHVWLDLRHSGRILSAGNLVARFEVFTTAGAMSSGTWRRDLWYKSAVI
jgi:hypothetical protein